MRDIQFRRGEFAFKGEVREISRMSRQIAIMLGAIVFFAVGSFGISYAALKGRVKKQISRISTLAAEALPDVPKKTLSSPNAILSMLGSKVNEAEEKKKKIEEETHLSVLEILKEFSVVVPPRETVVLDVDDLTISARRIRLQGKTNSFEAVDQIKAALAKSKMFKNVATENVKKGFRDEIRFNLSIEIAGSEPEAAGGG